MLPPKFGSHGVQLNHFLQHWVIAMPLHEIRSAHKGAMFAGSAVVVPKIEINKIDRMRKWRPRKNTFLLQAGYQVLSALYSRICVFDHLFSLTVNAIVCRCRMTLGADLFHLCLRGGVIRPFFSDR